VKLRSRVSVLERQKLFRTAVEKRNDLEQSRLRLLEKVAHVATRLEGSRVVVRPTMNEVLAGLHARLRGNGRLK